jgi:UDP:flavonoid glycosyltransferase YjiC (YdhE family)
MRVLMTSTPGAGHIGPLVRFAKAFRRAGVQVLVAVPGAAAATVRAEGLPLWAFDVPEARERDAIIASMLELGPEERARRIVGDVFAGIDARAAYPGALTAYRAWGPDVILSEACELAGALVAERVGIPSATIGISNAGRSEPLMDLAVAPTDALRAELGLAADPDGLALRCAPYLTLFPESLDDPFVAGVEVRRYREVATRALRPLGDWWPGDGRPLVYLSFGSVAPTMDLFPGLYREAVAALAALPVRVLVTIGRERDPADLGPLPANVHVERWLPQADVMPHATAMVCHGGSGTVRMGLAAGVPMAVLPLFADQPWNAQRVAELGAGVVIEDAGETGEAVGRLLGDGSYAASAQRAAAEISALPPVDAAVDAVCSMLVRSIAA